DRAELVVASLCHTRYKFIGRFPRIENVAPDSKIMSLPAISARLSDASGLGTCVAEAVGSGWIWLSQWNRGDETAFEPGNQSLDRPASSYVPPGPLVEPASFDTAWDCS